MTSSAENESKYNTFNSVNRNSAKSSDNDTEYSLQDAIEHIGFGRFQLRIAILSGLSLLADGMEIFVLSVLGPLLVCEWGLTSWQEASLSTVVFTGFLVGSPLLGIFSDRYGRRSSLLFSSMWGLYFGLLSASSPSYYWLLGLRMLVGVGVSGQPQVVNYFTEFLPIRLRGRLIMMMYVSLTFGAMMEVLLALVLIDSLGWRWWLFASATPLLIFFLAAYYTMPESPRYLLASGNKQEAQKTIEKIAIENKVELPKGTLRGTHAGPAPRGMLGDLFGESVRQTSCLLPIIWFSSVFSYYGMVLLNTELVNSGSNCRQGVDDTASGESCSASCQTLETWDYLTLLFTTSSELPALFCVTLLADTIGRKGTMIINFAVLIISSLMLCICMPYPAMVVFLYVGRGFMAAQVQLCYLYTSEVYPTTIRGIGLGYGSSIARIGALSTPVVAQVLASHNLRSSLGVYAGVGLIAIGTAWTLPIETKGRPLENCNSK